MNTTVLKLRHVLASLLCPILWLHWTCSNSRKVEEEMAQLSNMAETVNTRLATSGPAAHHPDDASQGSGEGVDLDNLFSFLSNMESEKHVLDEISRQMDELADNVNEEVLYTWAICVLYSLVSLVLVS